MTATITQAERAARAIRDDIVRTTGGRCVQWVPIHDVAQRLGLEDGIALAAIQHGIRQGWFVADDHPPHSVRLSTMEMHQVGEDGSPASHDTG